MGTRLKHIPFDIETAGFESTAEVTVVGLALPLGNRILLNADGRAVDTESLESQLATTFDVEIDLSTHRCEAELLTTLSKFVDSAIAPREYLLVAYNGERFNGGFDLPFLRTRYALQEQQWPFDGVPYADIYPLIRNRFNTAVDGEDRNDLVTASDVLVGDELSTLDPFDESSEAVEAFESGEFDALLAHNVADILRTAGLAGLAARFCGKSEFNLKSLTPTVRDPDLSSPQ